MKTVAVVILDILAVALMGGACAMHYFSLSKLGMVRWLNANTRLITEAVPFEVIKVVLLVVLLVAGILIARRVFGSHDRSRACTAQAAFSLAVIAVYAVCAIIMNSGISKAYVFIVLMLGIAAILQLVALCFARPGVVRRHEEGA